MLLDMVKTLHETVPGWDEDDRLFYDGMHVTDEGSRVFARAIAATLLDCCRP